MLGHRIHEKGEPAAVEIVGSAHVRDSADLANHILNRNIINESCSQILFKHTTVVGLWKIFRLTSEFLNVFFIFQDSPDFQLILNCCWKMTSSTTSASRGTPAPHGTLPGNQSTLHEHQISPNEHWGTLHGHQGILRADQDTLHERQVTPAAPATLNRHQSPPRTYRRTSGKADLYWRAVVIQEPISDDMKALVRADLKKAWYFARVENFRYELKTRWETTDSYRMVLDNALGEVELRKLKYLCNKPTAFYWLQSAQGKGGYTGGRADNIIERNPSTSQHYALSPLYRALLVIIDYRIEITDDQIEPDGFISLRKVSQDQSVLIMRTGLEEGLSAPISFESLKSHSLSLNRPDATMQGLDVIRVSLASAVHFIVNLEMRENDADPKSKDEDTLDNSLDIYPPKGYDIQVSHSPETWIDAVMAAAEEHGYDKILATSISIRRIEASKIGEDFCPFKYEPFGREWR